ncbi:helix-turn-helix transcriptional regulator [Hazenella coriacea]|uniref:Helix-turn-helix protein n=1 Tax=Hazenella coriacea TaxID=1179467 RepID=A0A4R3L590_9BACL|nr:helix-turn-helix transcriptional regulator [Hazenella coriacea]TCS94961.1 helix-turn-helix protein [Hazenella coriacea]
MVNDDKIIHVGYKVRIKPRFRYWMKVRTSEGYLLEIYEYEYETDEKGKKMRKVVFDENGNPKTKRVPLNQLNLAERLGMNKMQVNHWFTGKSFPRTEMLFEIANILNVPVDELYEVIVE